METGQILGQNIVVKYFFTSLGLSMCIAHEDKGRPISTWSRPIGEKVYREIR